MENKETINTIVRDDQVDYAVEALQDIMRTLNSAARVENLDEMRGLIAVAAFKASEARARIAKMDGMIFF